MKSVQLPFYNILLSLFLLFACSAIVNKEQSIDSKSNTNEEMNQDDRDKVTRLIRNQNWERVVNTMIEYTDKNPQNGEAWFYLGSGYHGQKDYANALAANQKAASLSARMRPSAYYNLACAYALLNDESNAVESLQMAMKYGFLDYDLLKTDTDIALLRKAGHVDLPTSHPYQKIIHNGIEIKYHLILPEGYDKSKTYPALLAYPPGGQKIASADWSLAEFWGTAAKTKGWIIVVPVAPARGWINHPAHHALNDLLNNIKSKHKVEGGKFHMLGFGSGARPATTFALMSRQYFKSLTTISSHAWDGWYENNLDQFKIMPVKMIVGELDLHGVEAAKRVQQIFINNNIRSELEIIPNQEHHLPQVRQSDIFEYFEDFVR